MSGVIVERKSDIAAAATSVEVAVCKLLLGESLIIRCRYAEAYINGTTAPSALAWEGPYVRVRPHQNRFNPHATRTQAFGFFADQERIARSAGGQITIPTDNLFYEFDAIGCPAIQAPYDCDVTIHPNRAGMWCFDWMILGADSQALKANARLYPQTRLVYGDGAANTRTVQVPLGCVEVQPTGYQDLNSRIILSSEDSGKVVGAGTSFMTMNDAAGSNTPPGQRFAVSGSRIAILSTGGATGLVSGAVFWCAL